MGNYEIAAKERGLENLSSSQIEGGYIINDEAFFRHWETLLDEWIDSIKKFCSETDSPPYVDNEMGNVGLLMAVAWRVGGIAVCEKLVDLKNQDCKVRLDLWMKLPESGIELIEAKHTYHLDKMKRDKSRDKYDYTVLKEEVIDRAQSLKIEVNQRAVAVVFLTRKLKEYRSDDNPAPAVDEKIRCLLNEKYVRHGWDVVAWCFPKEMRDSDFPGVILSAKYV